MRRLRLLAVVGVFLLGGSVAGCSAPGEDGTADTDGTESAVTNASPTGLLYFHGLSGLGFSRTMIVAQDADDDILAPHLTDAQLQAPPPQSALEFLAAHESNTVSGYSLGRIPVLRLMKADVAKIARVVMVDPTYDGSADLGRTVGGPITRAWLDGDPARTFLMVYGDVTRSVGGDTSYLSALSDHPRAELCYVPGDHARFRRADMTAALVAKDCADVTARLADAAP